MSLEHKLGSVDGDKTAQALMTVLDRIQYLTPQYQLMALGVMFIEVCEARRVNPRDVLRYATNLLEGPEANEVNFRAFRQYLREELSPL